MMVKQNKYAIVVSVGKKIPDLERVFECVKMTNLINDIAVSPSIVYGFFKRLKIAADRAMLTQ